MTRRRAWRLALGAGGTVALLASLALWSEYGMEVLLSGAILSCL